MCQKGVRNYVVSHIKLEDICKMDGSYKLFIVTSLQFFVFRSVLGHQMKKSFCLGLEADSRDLVRQCPFLYLRVTFEFT